MDAQILQRHREVWTQKPVLQALYKAWYDEMATHRRPGLTLEIGAGSGNLKEQWPNVIGSDVVAVPWLDLVADSQNLPFASSSIGNIVLFDVLHHIPRPSLFWDEARRILVPQGRVIMMEPYMSWLSWPIYRFLHPEPVDFAVDPLEAPLAVNGHTADANQAVATMLFERSGQRFAERYPEFRIRLRRRLAFFAYPLSGGFDHPSLIPIGFVKPLVALERGLSLLARACAFRILVVLEKTG